jgi:hypothetical protein
MITSLLSGFLSFVGGSAFRMIWGEVSSYLTKKQDHAQELDRLKLQGQLDAAQHARNLEALRLQSDLGIKTIEVQREAALDQMEGSAWGSVVESTTKMTGIDWIDAWNSSIRPLLATFSIVMMFVEVYAASFVLTDWTRGIIGAALGIYLADRSLKHRGK